MHTGAPAVPTEATEDVQSVENLSQPGGTRAVLPDTTEKPDEPDGTVNSDVEIFAEEIAEEAAVSPYGFGPYPPLPERWPADIWPRKSPIHELMIRVQIKLVSQGINARELS